MKTFNLDEAVKTANDYRHEDHERVFGKINLRIEANSSRLEATDTYRAVRINLPSGIDYPANWLQAGGATLDLQKGDPVTWEFFLHAGKPEAKGIHRFDDVFIGVSGSTHQFDMEPIDHYKQGITDFGYFDGERRRPQGLIGLFVDPVDKFTTTLGFERGMRVFGDQRVRSFLAWEDSRTPLAKMDRPKGFDIPTDDGTYLHKQSGYGTGQLGVYAAEYLSELDRSTKLGWSGVLKPLAFETRGGTYEHLVMPIRM